MMATKVNFDPKQHLHTSKTSSASKNKQRTNNYRKTKKVAHGSKYKSEWKAQDDAFFGTSMSSLERKDHEFAQRLQNELSEQPQNDLEFAKRLQSQPSDSAIIQEDLKFAQKLQSQDSNLRKDLAFAQQLQNQPSDSHLKNDLEFAKLLQNQDSDLRKDLEFAKQLQNQPSDSHLGNDLEFAKRLQNQDSNLRKDLEFAKQLQNQPSDSHLENDLVFAKRLQNKRDDSGIMQQDQEYAKILQAELEQEQRKKERMDEEFARQLNEQSLCLDRFDLDNSNSVGGMHNSMDDSNDLEVALIMQKLESLGKGNLISMRNLKSNGGDMDIQDMKEVLRQAEMENSVKNQFSGNLSGMSRHSSAINLGMDLSRNNSTCNDNLHNSFSSFDLLGNKRSNRSRGTSSDLASRRESNGSTRVRTSKTHIIRNDQDIPSCDVCGELASHYLSALGKIFHPPCFTCTACDGVISPNEPFCYTKKGDEKFPLHRSCYSSLYGMKCSVCRNTIPHDSAKSTISYVKHPFFSNDKICHTCAERQRRCTSCSRYEPTHHKFFDLEDNDRCVCYSCCRTVVVDTEDAKPLYKLVMNYFERSLELPVWDGMKEIPVLIVGSDTLNESKSSFVPHEGNLTRGLCLSEHQSGRTIALQRMLFDKAMGSFRSVESNETFEIPTNIAKATKSIRSAVTAILCLSGLPRDLTISILAHEATHAWIKLHPNFDITKHIPPQVEEGVCQLVAHLILSDGLEPASTKVEDENDISDEKLRQYFKFAIEADENEIYGEGFRRAANAYSAIGIYELLNYIVQNADIPNL